jgi:hypothetical protein
VGRRIVLDQHVGPCQQAQQQVAPGLGARVEGDAVLVGVQEVEQAALLGMGHVAGEGATAPGDVAALRRLDLDHLGSVVGEQLGAVGCRDHLAQLDDCDAFQGTVGHFDSSQLAARPTLWNTGALVGGAGSRYFSAASPGRRPRLAIAVRPSLSGHRDRSHHGKHGAKGPNSLE